MATLDTGLGWVAGDPERVLIAWGLGVSEYSINQITTCMNQLGTFSPSSVAAVRTLLDDYDTADTTLSSLNTTNEGKVLVKADVLEWEVPQGSQAYSVQMEIGKIQGKIGQYFSFCPLSGAMANGYINTVPLIRS